MVDLIPDDYRRSLRLRLRLRIFFGACVGAVALIGLARIGLTHLIHAEQTELAALHQVKAASGAQRAKLSELQARKDAVEREVKALEILRDPAIIGELFFAVDAATTGKMWFNEFSFTRDGERTDTRPQSREATPVLPVPPAAAIAKAGQSTPSTTQPAWHQRPRAGIRGQAPDHSTLADFINRFGGQPGIGSVRLEATSTSNAPDGQFVDFQLAAFLAPTEANSR